MNATITWTISSMQCKPQEGDLTDVVITANWLCVGQQTEGEATYAGNAYGSCGFSAPGDPFTPYDQLTQEQVLGWVWASGVDKDATEAAVQQQIDNQINPPSVNLPLPWAPAEQA